MHIGLARKNDQFIKSVLKKVHANSGITKEVVDDSCNQNKSESEQNESNLNQNKPKINQNQNKIIMKLNQKKKNNSFLLI